MGLRRLLRRDRRPAERPGLPTPALTGPPLAVVVICYEMTHQVGNTVRSLLPPYQVGVSADQYEIHLIDNGSARPLPESVWNLGPNVRYRHVPKGEAPVNPGVAINEAVSRTTSPTVCVMIDGARMVTPGVIRWGLDLSAASANAVVEVRAWHLGDKLQNKSVHDGYDSAVEKGLLDRIDWPTDGYKLFDIATPAASTAGGFYGLAAESTCLFLPRQLFDRLGGYDGRYAEPGGGLCNADFFVRAVSAADVVFTMLGEGTFHQIHGGAATGNADLRQSFRRWKAEYERLSRPWHKDPVQYTPLLAGHVPVAARRWVRRNRTGINTDEHG